MYDDISEADQIHTMMVVVLEVIRNSPSFVEIELEEAILLQDEITFTCRHLHQDVLNDVQLTNTLAAYRRDLHKAISSWLGTLPPDLFTAMLHVRNGIHWRIRNDRLGVDTLERTLAWLRQTQSSTASDAWSSGASEDSSDESGHGMSEGSSNSADRSDVTRNQEDECNWMFHDGPSPGKPSQRRCAGPFVADEQDGFLIVEKPSDKSGSRGAMDRLLDMCEIEEIEESSMRVEVDTPEIPDADVDALSDAVSEISIDEIYFDCPTDDALDLPPNSEPPAENLPCPPELPSKQNSKPEQKVDIAIEVSRAISKLRDGRSLERQFAWLSTVLRRAADPKEWEDRKFAVNTLPPGVIGKQALTRIMDLCKELGVGVCGLDFEYCAPMTEQVVPQYGPHTPRLGLWTHATWSKPQWNPLEGDAEICCTTIGHPLGTYFLRPHYDDIGGDVWETCAFEREEYAPLADDDCRTRYWRADHGIGVCWLVDFLRHHPQYRCKSGTCSRDCKLHCQAECGPLCAEFVDTHAVVRSTSVFKQLAVLLWPAEAGCKALEELDAVRFDPDTEVYPWRDLDRKTTNVVAEDVDQAIDTVARVVAKREEATKEARKHGARADVSERRTDCP